MKKNYTRKQILEAINYWQKQLKESQYSDKWTDKCETTLKKIVEIAREFLKEGSQDSDGAMTSIISTLDDNGFSI